VAIIDHGTLLALDTPVHLVRGMSGDRTLDCSIEPGPTGDAASLGLDLGRLPGVRMVDQLDEPGAGTWRFRIDVEGEAAPFVAPVAQLVDDAGARLTDVRLGEPNLEDVFIHLTGRALR
jgi:ABC-2 type transport system ATP-binding protein